MKILLVVIFVCGVVCGQSQFGSGSQNPQFQPQPRPSAIQSANNIVPQVEKINNRTFIIGKLCVPGQWCNESDHCCPATTGRFRCCPQLTQCSSDGLLCFPMTGFQQNTTNTA